MADGRSSFASAVSSAVRGSAVSGSGTSGPGASRRYDVDAVRRQFPSLRAGIAHFDGPGGSQVPAAVGDAVRDTLTASIANRGRVTAAERFAERVVLDARSAVADLLGADPGGIVFGRSMTALTFDFARTLARSWAPGDEVVVSSLDHDANVRPWVLAADAAGAVVRWAEFDPGTAELPVDRVREVVGERTRLVAVTAASNLIGTRPDVAEIASLAHDVGALCYVDGVHFAAHGPVDVRALGADFFACSPYKFLGPHLGVLAAAPATLEPLRPDKLLPSSDAVPERFEFGTLPYELLAGTTAAVDFLAGINDEPVAGSGAPGLDAPGAPSGPAETLQDQPPSGPTETLQDQTPSGSATDRRRRLLRAMSAIDAHELRLRESLERALAELGGVRVHSRARDRTPTLLLTFDRGPAAEASRLLADLGVNAPAGSFYAIEPSRRLGLGVEGGLRVGLAPYTDDRDVDRLLDGLRAWLGGRPSDQTSR